MPANPTLTSPLSFGREAAPEALNLNANKVHQISAVFDRQLAEGLHPGAQLVVLLRGQVLLDRAAGLAQTRNALPVTPETPFLTFSCSKAFTSICVHRLIEEGRVELDAPVAHYWPEFGCNGKEKATIRHAFLHQAGIPLAGLNVESLLAWNWEWTARYVASLKAEFEPGSQCAYHLVNYGFILGEVVRRVTGQRIDRYLHDTFLHPLGLKHSFMGLPWGEFKRAAALYLGHPENKTAVNAFNFPLLRHAVIPAAALNSTAREMATFYQMLLNGGSYAGRQYLRPETIRAATTMGYHGADSYIKTQMRWAYGFHLGGGAAADPSRPSGMGRQSTERTFGHFGQASCMAWADPDHELVVAFTCNRLISNRDADLRWAQLSEAVWAAVKS